METGSPEWRARHLSGVRAAAQRPRVPCKVKGCDRSSSKGGLCLQHWRMVPISSKTELIAACFMAERKMAQKYHRRFVREVQALEAHA